MSVRSFLDTNIFVYTDDASAGEKRWAALELYRRVRGERSGVISTQVLQEYFAVAVKKLGVPADKARRKVELISRLDVVSVDVDHILGAIDLHRLHGFSIWDALIVRAALVARCSVLWSEDLEAGRTIDGLEIRNPFV